MLKKVKNILGILLAVCFVMSITAAAVSAASDPEKSAPGYGVKNLPVSNDTKKMERGEK
jgi:hypothetical protein